MPGQNDQNLFSRQIDKSQNDKRLIEFCDSLACAEPKMYAHMHASGEKGADGFKKYSRITINILDYSKGTGTNTVSAKFNLEPAKIKWLLEETKRELAAWRTFNMLRPLAMGANNVEAKSNVLIQMLNILKPMYDQKNMANLTAQSNYDLLMPSFIFTEEKLIAANKDANGRSPMSKLTIKRSPYDQTGKLMGYPWLVSIENGTAIAVENSNGGAAAQKGSFTVESKAFMRLADDKWEQMLLNVVTYIEAFENTYCIKNIREARAMMEAERAAFAQSTQTGSRQQMGAGPQMGQPQMQAAPNIPQYGTNYRN